MLCQVKHELCLQPVGRRRVESRVGLRPAHLAAQQRIYTTSGASTATYENGGAPLVQWARYGPPLRGPGRREDQEAK
jgi:hypothetical protein